MWFAQSPDLLHWGSHVPLTIPGSEWQSGRVGAGPPPIRVPAGWLAIYHGNRRPSRPGDVGEYAAGALLLDANDPTRVLKWTPSPLLRPEMEWELEGFVPNVIFPTGVVQDDQKLFVYYGAADAVCAVAELRLQDIFEN